MAQRQKIINNWNKLFFLTWSGMKGQLVAQIEQKGSVTRDKEPRTSSRDVQAEFQSRGTSVSNPPCWSPLLKEKQKYRVEFAKMQTHKSQHFFVNIRCDKTGDSHDSVFTDKNMKLSVNEL